MPAEDLRSERVAIWQGAEVRSVVGLLTRPATRDLLETVCHVSKDASLADVTSAALTMLENLGLAEAPLETPLAIARASSRLTT